MRPPRKPTRRVPGQRPKTRLRGSGSGRERGRGRGDESEEDEPRTRGQIPPKKDNTPLIIGGCVGGGILLLIIIIAVASGGSEPPPPQEQEPEVTEEAGVNVDDLVRKGELHCQKGSNMYFSLLSDINRRDRMSKSERESLRQKLEVANDEIGKGISYFDEAYELTDGKRRFDVKDYMKARRELRPVLGELSPRKH